MSSNKTKLLESAQKNFLKGHYDRAVYDYRQLVQLEPSDLRHRQKVAEILTKANQKDEAIKEYSSLAKIYIDSVHYLKAIAVYKQIQKLDPTNPEISLTLASLNEKQGLIGNATAEYASAVQIYEKNGENLKALKALESMISLDSSNSAVKLRLAEKYHSTGSEEKSFEVFVSTLKDLKERDDENGFVLIAQKATALFGHKAQMLLQELENTEETTDTVEEVAYNTNPTTPIITLQNNEENSCELILPNSDNKLVDTVTDSKAVEIEVDYIEDIQPLDDDEVVEMNASEEPDEWEEEIELDFLDTDSAPIDNLIATSIDISADGLDDLELELEIEDFLKVETSDSYFDLGDELSIFANEIDFKLLGEDKSDQLFDVSSFGLKKSDLTNEDAESHYSLGLAYKEMGLFDEAISEFIFASNAPERKIDSLILQGVCFRETGNFQKAIDLLNDLSKDSNITDDELLGVQYELALCHESSGNKTQATELFCNIVNINPKFSDAAIRLKKLSV